MPSRTVSSITRETVDSVLGAGVRGSDRHRFWCRVELLAGGARSLLAALYPQHDLDELERRVLSVVAGGLRARRRPLRELDARREIEPMWFQSNEQIGYVAYAERFGGTLSGVRDHLDHLDRLHITYLHLMHVVRAREGENDGGYAVVDYTDVEPRLGTRRDLQRLADDLHARGVSLCLDVVMNHTAREHLWAQAARAGSAHHRSYYHVFDDRTMPDRYERTLPEVFPQMAPGNFTFEPEFGPDGSWVWTSFHDYQWDLNYANPDVFIEMLQVTLDLANAGVDVLRLDAIAFTWKRMGTNCQNQPEAHLLAQLFRACIGMAAPGVVLKAEAIVAPNDLVPYLGAHRQQRDECQLAYHNQLMVVLWDALCTEDATLATASLTQLPPTPTNASWATYLRCHDDIGWAIDDDVAASVSIGGRAHRQHLAEFYRGDAPSTFALGAAFSANPAANDERTCGMAASLAGIERAVRDGDADRLDQAVRRLLLGYAVTFSFGGTPLLYMGDEIAMQNDWSYLDDPQLRDDSRWLHRPFMDWPRVDEARSAGEGTVARRVFEGIRSMAAVRRATPALSMGGEQWMHRLDHPALLAWERRHPRHGRFYGIANVSVGTVTVERKVLAWAGLDDPVELLGGDVDLCGETMRIGPLSVGWFVDRPDGDVQPTPGP
ncbi:MAG: ams [Ilumatobacteraceae bacterium]|nr:ams [Ilumatobacteraceae bacterium]